MYLFRFGVAVVLFEDKKYDCERLLGLLGEYGPNDLRKAYRRAAKTNHPDIAKFHGVSTAQAEENMKQINEAQSFIQGIFDSYPFPESISSDYFAEEAENGSGIALYNDDVFVGGFVNFGQYLIDSRKDFSPISWYVLEIIGDEALLISEQCLDCRPFSSWPERELVVWENSSLRQWLNNVFYDRAFTNDEKECILRTRCNNAETNLYGVHGGPNTLDNVFLLDSAQAKRLFANSFDASSTATRFAVSRGVCVDADQGCHWWLRNPGRVSTAFSGSSVVSVGEIPA